MQLQYQLQQHVAPVHETAAAHLTPIPESAVVGPAADQVDVVTSYSCCHLLLFWAWELITSPSLTNHIQIFTSPLLGHREGRSGLTV